MVRGSRWCHDMVYNRDRSPLRDGRTTREPPFSPLIDELHTEVYLGGGEGKGVTPLKINPLNFRCKEIFSTF